jgi:hypothetical protein
MFWSAVPGATSYNLYRDGVKVSSTANGRNAKFSVSSGAHVYGVTAVTAAGESVLTTARVP